MKISASLQCLLLAAMVLVPSGVDAAEGVPSRLSAASLFNVGNAALKEGRLGEAILNYERASWLKPNDPDIDANLRLARSKAGLWNGERAWWDRLVHRASLANWGIVLAAGIFLLAAILPLGLLMPQARPIWTIMRFVALLTCIIAGASMVMSWGDLSRAVITAKETTARVAPAAASGAAFHLREGEVVRVTRIHGEFCLALNRDGRQGWTRLEHVQLVVPR